MLIGNGNVDKWLTEECLGTFQMPVIDPVEGSECTLPRTSVQGMLAIENQGLLLCVGLEEVLGYAFNHPSLLDLVMSCVFSNEKDRLNRQNLGFLGDALIDFHISSTIRETTPTACPGALIGLLPHMIPLQVIGHC